ncbi:MAG: hypothetical protein A3H25_00080 [Sphingomonadales bacterium RIFCSPLOWO2_12_FULL_63_15]|nr:MAG: hypothetical protein A3H25_00080 [Sphingomonadales bacterium RIFCSPLOWO2_12_FULL_63_15]
MLSSPAPDRNRAALFALLGWMLCSAVMLALFRTDIATLGFRDPDDAMRLVQIRDWIGGQAFWDVSQHRVNPPLGGPMHWSRIVDMPVAALILLFTPLLGATQAEILACVIVPLLLLGGLTAALFIAARRIAGPIVALLSVVLLLTTPSILVQFTPLRIDHHGWQILLAAIALCGATDDRPARGGTVAALALALWLQISSESLPYVALFGAAFALRHWIARDQAPRFIAFALTLGGAALFLLALLRGPNAAMASHCDALSYVYVWSLVAMAIATLAAARAIGTATAPNRFAIAAIGGGAALATFALTGGPCLSGDPFAALGPLAYKLWYLQVVEGRPIWEQSLSMRDIILLPSMLGLGAALLAARTAQGEARLRWLLLALLLLGATGVAMLVMRALSVAHVLALPGIAWLLIALFRRIQSARTALVRVSGSVALALLTPVGLSALWTALASPPEPAAQKGGDCRSASMLAPLRALPPATLFAPLDLGPDILARTGHSVIGTAHHRNAVGITTVIQGFVDRPDQARATIAQTRATYLVTCNGLNELRLYAKTNPAGLAALLAKGKPPAWLEQLPTKEPLRLYRIRPE